MKKIEVEVCVGTSCFLMGSQAILDTLKDLSGKLKKKITVKHISCMNRCERGPVVKIDGRALENATPEQVVKEIKDEFSF
ncbi:MAG: NAD(P)H-dependent oxidoreductase subunit E [Bacillota bacterium]